MTSPNSAMVSSWKQTLDYMASGCTNLEPVCVSFLSRRNIVLIKIGPLMFFYIFFLFTLISSLMYICLNYSKYSSIFCLTRFLRLIFVSELTDGMSFDFTKKSRLLCNLTYESWVLVMNEVICLLFWMSIQTFAFSNSTSFLSFFPNSSGTPLHCSNHSCTEIIADCITFRVLT